jgi:regulator of replication initiation timing
LSGNPVKPEVDIGNLKKLPQLLEEVIAENKKITDENKRLQDAVGEILEDFANRIAALEKRAGIPPKE